MILTAKGILLRFDCRDGAQYDAIGDFWDFLSDFWPLENLSGVGFNWEENTFCYLIGWIRQEPPPIPKEVWQRYPQARFSQIRLPDEGWQHYTCHVDNLARLYDGIWREGPLDYEIERFDREGNSRIAVFRFAWQS